MTSEKANIIRSQERERLDAYRASQTPEQRNLRLESELKRVTSRILFETEEETEARRQGQAERTRNNWIQPCHPAF